MSRDRAQRSLLFGSLAYRLGVLDPGALARFLTASAADPSRDPGDVLVETAGRAGSAAGRVGPAMDDLLAAHGGDPARALRSTPPDPAARDALAAVRDADIEAVVRGLGPAWYGEQDPFATFNPLAAARHERPALAGVPAELDPGGAATGAFATGPQRAGRAGSGPGPAGHADGLDQTATYEEGRQGPPAASLETLIGSEAHETVAGPSLTLPEPPDGAAADPRSVAGPEAEHTVAEPSKTLPAASNGAARGLETTVASVGGEETIAEGSAVGRAKPALQETLLGETMHPTRSAAGAPPGAAGRKPPSRFRVVRPHAKGGLGEVYVALDGELNREVALKQIQDRHADDMVSRARFVVEAEVTGCLEHPGIVPVYGLGEYIDGRPYYAMRFVHGDSLKEAITHFHEPPDAGGGAADAGSRALELHKLLRRFVDVCNAMEYAHSRGVIHRDLKPANIMLGPFGETLVVDWGLAKPLDRLDDGDGAEPALDHAREAGRSIDSGPGTGRVRPMSASGSMYEVLFGSTVGTPHYMSPEQAAGEVDLGPASDIYSLGATLYHLLAGTTPFTDRKIGPLLDKVRKGTFPPPRQVNPKVPPALNAVCLKAMALKVEDRYPTARALAEDLEHWMADEPVSAYREPWTARAARWARKHKTLVTTAASLLVVSVAGLSVTAYLIDQERARTEANFVLARSAVDTMLTSLGAVQLVDVPGAEGVRREMLEKARDFYLAFLQGRNGKRPSVRQGAGEAYVRAGEVQEQLGQYPDAEASLKAAIALLSPMAKDPSPAADPFRRDLARARHDYGILLTRLSRYKDAEAELQAAVDLRKLLASRKGAPASDLADEKESVYRLGALVARRPGNRDRARGYYDQAIREAEAVVSRTEKAAAPASLEARRDLARYRNNLANLLYWSDSEKADRTYEQAREALAALRTEAPNVTAYNYALSRTLNNLASLNRDMVNSPTSTPEQWNKRRAAALGLFSEAAKLLGGLAHDYPKVPEYRFELADIHRNRARLYLEEPKMTREIADFAEKDLEAARYHFQVLTREYPGRPDYRLHAANVRVLVGLLQRKSALIDRADATAPPLKADESRRRSLLDRAVTEDGQALDELRGAVDEIRAIPTSFKEFADSLDYRLSLAQAYRWLGITLLKQQAEHPEARRHDADESLRALEPGLKEAVSLCASVLRDDPTKRDAAGASRNCLGALFEIQNSQGRYRDAIESMLALAADLRTEPQPSPVELGRAGRLIARSLTRADDPTLTERFAPEALKLLKEAVNRGFANPAEFSDPDYKSLGGMKAFDDLKKAVKNPRPVNG